MIIKANGRETGRITLTAEPRVWEVPYRAVDGGTNTIEAVYTGDANFLPMTKTWNLTVTRGFAGLTGVAYRDAGTLTIEVRGTGSPMAAPSGIVSVEEPGAIPAASVPLTETAPGVAQASITLNDVASGPHRLVIHYSGDTRYEPRTQILTVSGPPGGATY